MAIEFDGEAAKICHYQGPESRVQGDLLAEGEKSIHHLKLGFDSAHQPSVAAICIFITTGLPA